MRIDNVPQTVHVQRTMYWMDKSMGNFTDPYRMDKNGWFRGFVTVHSATDFQGLVNMMMYVHIRIMLHTPEQGHRLWRWLNINLQQQPADGNEYGKKLSIFAMIMAEGTSKQTKEPPFEWNVREILNSNNQTNWNGLLSEWKHATG